MCKGSVREKIRMRDFFNCVKRYDLYNFRWMYKGNKEREARRLEEIKNSEKIQINSDLKSPKIYETSENNGFENLAFESEECTKK